MEAVGWRLASTLNEESFHYAFKIKTVFNPLPFSSSPLPPWKRGHVRNTGLCGRITTLFGIPRAGCCRVQVSLGFSGRRGRRIPPPSRRIPLLKPPGSQESLVVRFRARLEPFPPSPEGCSPPKGWLRAIDRDVGGGGGWSLGGVVSAFPAS